MSRPLHSSSDGQASTSTSHLNGTRSTIRQRNEYTNGGYNTSSASKSDLHETKGPSRGKRKRKEWTWEMKRGWVSGGFRVFGEHCARNQIRTLLIDCLVMTNLFYPALAVYLVKKFPPLHPPTPSAHNAHQIPIQGQSGSLRRIRKEHPLSLLSTPVLDSFFPYPPPLLPRLSWSGWWGRDTGQWHDEGWNVVEVPSGYAEDGQDEIRVMRIGWADVGDVLDRDPEEADKTWLERDHILLSLVRDMVEGWDQDYPTSGTECVRELGSQPGPCYITGPKNPPEPARVISLSSLSTEPSDRTSSNGTTRPDTVSVELQSENNNLYHSVAAIFRMTPASSTAFKTFWTENLANLAKSLDGEVYVEANGLGGTAAFRSEHWLLSYNQAREASPLLDSKAPLSHIITPQPPKLVLLLYLLLFVTLGAQLSNASKVHSRFGLALTGVVQICCSAVMSFSVLSLLGWNGWGSSHAQPTLPTWVLPFVIVVVGAENMSTLTKAVFSVPFTYSVPVRIGLGLSKVGTTIALTSLTDLALLGIVWLCVNLAPVREFCLFAAVVIITDWFMLHTFFLTVLSIDAQRLELADVLASNAGGVVDPARPEGSSPTADDRDHGLSWRRMLRARTNKSGSLALLLLTVGVLYYLTERHRAPSNATAALYGYVSTSVRAPSSTASAFPTNAAHQLNLTGPEKLWHAINPTNLPYVRVGVPPASIILLPQPGHQMRPADIRNLSLKTSRLLLPRLKPLFYLFKVVILPQAVTAGALYMLLLYLLKDTELLDAQRDKLGRGQIESHDDSDAIATGQQQRSVLDAVEAHMLPGSHESDIDIIASSADGKVVLTIGIDNTVLFWRFNDEAGSTGTRERYSAINVAEGDHIVAASLGYNGRHHALCTREGRFLLFQLQDDNRVVLIREHKLDDRDAKIRAIAVDYQSASEIDPFSEAKELRGALIAYSDGSIWSLPAWDSVSPVEGVISAISKSARVLFLQEDNSERARILIASQFGVALYVKSASVWVPTTIPAELVADDMVTTASIKTIVLQEYLLELLVIGFKSGIVQVFETNGTHVVSIGRSVSSGAILSVDIAAPSKTRCTSCETASSASDGFFIISSTSSHTFVDRILPRQAVFCKCPPHRRQKSSADPSRSPTPNKSSPAKGLVVPPSTIREETPGNSPRKSPSLLPPVSNGDFPLSNHGARRLSNMHRDDEYRVRPPSPSDKALSSGMVYSSSAGSMASHNGTDRDVHPLGAIFTSSYSGGWAVLRNDMLITLRRVGGAIDDSGWQVVSVDLTQAWNGSTLIVDAINLSELVQKTFHSSKFEDEGVSIRQRRYERLMSLDGRAPFPSYSENFSVPTYPSLAYVSIRPFLKRGDGSILAGFGNRLGIISLSDRARSKADDKRRGTGDFSRAIATMGKGSVGLGIISALPPPPSNRRSGNEQDAASKKVN